MVQLSITFILCKTCSTGPERRVSLAVGTLMWWTEDLWKENWICLGFENKSQGLGFVRELHSCPHTEDVPVNPYKSSLCCCCCCFCFCCCCFCFCCCCRRRRCCRCCCCCCRRRRFCYHCCHCFCCCCCHNFIWGLLLFMYLKKHWFLGLLREWWP